MGIQRILRIKMCVQIQLDSPKLYAWFMIH